MSIVSGRCPSLATLTPPGWLSRGVSVDRRESGKSRLLDHGREALDEGGAGPPGVPATAGPGGPVVGARAGGHPAQVEGDGRQAALQAGPEQVGGDQLVAGGGASAGGGALAPRGPAD